MGHTSLGNAITLPMTKKLSNGPLWLRMTGKKILITLLIFVLNSSNFISAMHTQKHESKTQEQENKITRKSYPIFFKLLDFIKKPISDYYYNKYTLTKTLLTVLEGKVEVKTIAPELIKKIKDNDDTENAFLIEKILEKKILEAINNLQDQKQNKNQNKNKDQNNSNITIKLDFNNTTNQKTSSPTTRQTTKTNNKENFKFFDQELEDTSNIFDQVTGQTPETPKQLIDDNPFEEDSCDQEQEQDNQEKIQDTQEQEENNQEHFLTPEELEETGLTLEDILDDINITLQQNKNKQ